MDKAPSRLPSLDGLRGLAAIVVVVHHTFLTVPSLSVAYVLDGPKAVRGSNAWWLSWTPLHLVWAGGEAVIVFFVLSGFVLVRAYLDHSTVAWNAYYAKRLIRLYIPVLVAVIVAWILMVTVSRTTGSGGSTWLVSLHPGHVGLTYVIHDMVLITRPPGAVSSVLWSLHWEVIFSLLLPFFVFVAGLGRRNPWLLGLGACALVAVSPQSDESVYYLSIFLIGATLAAAYPRIEMWIDRRNHSATRSVLWSTMIVVALLLLVSHWLIGRTLAGHGLSIYKVEAVLRVSYGVGAAMLIIAALGSAWFKELLTFRPVHWLGSRSYSLYLVHEPIIVTCAFAFGRTPSMTWFLPLMLVISLGATEVFFRLIERPSVKLASRVGARLRSPAAPAGHAEALADLP